MVEGAGRGVSDTDLAKTWRKRWRVLKPEYHRMLKRLAEATTGEEKAAALADYEQFKRASLPPEEIP